MMYYYICMLCIDRIVSHSPLSNPLKQLGPMLVYVYRSIVTSLKRTNLS